MAQVALAGVAQHGHHRLPRAQFHRHLDGRVDDGAGGDAGEQALLPGQQAGRS